MSHRVTHVSDAPAAAHQPLPRTERRHIPTAARGPYLTALCESWRRARELHDQQHPALALAVAAYARDGRARGVPVEILLRAMDTVVRPDGEDPTLDFGGVRSWAGALLIRSYYRDD